MKKSRILVLLAGMLLCVTACNVSLPEGESGSIALIPFFDRERGMQGVMPLEGWTDRAVLLQESFPGTLDELIAEIAADTDLIALPRSTGTYRGSAFTWDLYQFHTQLADTGPGIYRVDLGLAKSDSAYYFVALVTLPADYAANEPLYKTVFTHALYALSPMG
jgi:hypothetical protein